MSTFKSLGLPGEDDLDDYVKERGAPVLATATPAAPEPVVSAPPPAPKPAPTTKMAIEVPNYLPARLKKMAFEKDCTIRFLILDALQQAGCEIKPEDRQKDGRKSPKTAIASVA